MTPKQLKTAITAKDFANLYLFAGNEKFLINQYLELVKGNALTGLFDDFNLFEFENENPDDVRTKSTVNLEDVEQAVAQFPQMSDRILVIVKYSKFLELNDTKIQKLLENIPQETTLIFVEEDIKKISKPLLSIIEKVGQVVDFSKQSKADLAKWANMLFSKANKKVEINSLNWLVDVLDKDMFALSNTIDKLIFSTDEEIIPQSLIEQLVPVSAEYKIYDFSDKLIANNSKAVYQLLNDFKRNKEEPVVIITLLFGQLHAILMIKELKESGYPNPSDFLAPNMKWLAGKLSGISWKIDKDRLLSTMNLCAQYDFDIKSGLIDGYPALEIIIANWFKSLT